MIVSIIQNYQVAEFFLWGGGVSNRSLFPACRNIYISCQNFSLHESYNLAGHTCSTSTWILRSTSSYRYVPEKGSLPHPHPLTPLCFPHRGHLQHTGMCLPRRQKFHETFCRPLVPPKCFLLCIQLVLSKKFIRRDTNHERTLSDDIAVQILRGSLGRGHHAHVRCRRSSRGGCLPRQSTHSWQKDNPGGEDTWHFTLHDNYSTARACVAVRL